MGGANLQQVTYIQLLTQYVQGFAQNIVDESDESTRKRMLLYLSDLMEDTTDFAWSKVKAANMVIL